MSRHHEVGAPVGEVSGDAPPCLDVDEPLRVVCWNVHKGKHHGLEQELGEVAVEREPDLLLLQEARPSLRLPPGYHGHHGRSYRHAFLRHDEGVMTLSKVAPTRAERVRSSRRELMLLTPKAALVSRFPMSDGRVLTCANIHGLNFDRSGRQLGRQLTELHSFLDPIDGPLIVAGDFNTWNESRMGVVGVLHGGLGLDEVLPDYPGGRKGSAPGERVERWLRLERQLHLDRMFVRDLRAIDSAWLDSFRCSDHVPLAARLSWC